MGNSTHKITTFIPYYYYSNSNNLGFQMHSRLAKLHIQKENKIKTLATNI